MFLYQRRELGPEAACTGCFVDHDAAACFANRPFDRFEIERHQRPEIDDLSIDAGLFHGRKRDVDHGTISQNRYVRSLAADRGLAARNGIMAVWTLAHRLLGPRPYGLIVMLLKRTILKPLGIETTKRNV